MLRIESERERLKSRWAYDKNTFSHSPRDCSFGANKQFIVFLFYEPTRTSCVHFPLPSPLPSLVVVVAFMGTHAHSGKGGTQIFAPKSGQRTVPKHTCPPCTLGSFRFGIPIAVAESQSQPQSRSESEFKVRGSPSVSLFCHCCNYRWAHVA